MATFIAVNVDYFWHCTPQEEMFSQPAPGPVTIKMPVAGLEPAYGRNRARSQIGCLNQFGYTGAMDLPARVKPAKGNTRVGVFTLLTHCSSQAFCICCLAYLDHV